MEIWAATDVLMDGILSKWLEEYFGVVLGGIFFMIGAGILYAGAIKEIMEKKRNPKAYFDRTSVFMFILFSMIIMLLGLGTVTLALIK